jgi:hypothetical protein
MHTNRATSWATRERNDTWGVALSNVDVVAEANPLTLFLAHNGTIYFISNHAEPGQQDVVVVAT